MTQPTTITVRHANPRANPSLAYTGRVHRDFAQRFGIHPDRVLDAILTYGACVTKRYIFTLTKGV